MQFVSTISSDPVIVSVISGSGNLEGKQFVETILLAVIRRP